MKKLLLAAMFFVTCFASTAQNDSPQSTSEQVNKGQKIIHRIVFQLNTDDTTVHKTLMKQLNNVFTLAPDSKMEVVCHGAGLNMLMSGKTIVQDKIQQLKDRGVVFVACEFSMSERKISKEQMIPAAGFVKGAIVEIATKQEEGWSYIRSGF